MVLVIRLLGVVAVVATVWSGGLHDPTRHTQAVSTSPAVVQAAYQVPSPAVPPRRSSVTRPTRPIVIGHRGASGYRPEHTLASYDLAARMGADFIEPDLVPTRDHVLVARHDNSLDDTTDVAKHPEFASRRTTKVIDGRSHTGWFVEDFTLAELRTLRAKERLPTLRPASAQYDGRFQVPTFDEILALRARLSAELHRPLGVFPELKMPGYFASIGLDLQTPFVAAVSRAGLNSPTAPLWVQCFDLSTLQQLRADHGLTAREMLLTPSQGVSLSPEGLSELAGKGVQAIGPDASEVIPRTSSGALGSPTTLVADAHRAGLLVFPWTFRAENTFLPTDFRVGTAQATPGRVVDLEERFLAAGVDGFFTDQADRGVTAVNAYLVRVSYRKAA